MQPGPIAISGEASPGVATPFGTPLVYMEPPSEAAKIIGILVMVYGGLTLAGGIFSAIAGPLFNEWMNSMDPDFQDFSSPNWVYLVQGLIGIAAGAGYLYSGWLVQNYKRRGIYFVWGILVVSMLLQLVFAAVQPYPDVEGMDGETLRLISVGGAALGGICGAGICGLLTAIPLFMTNHGME
jgi:hypothetical protein